VKSENRRRHERVSLSYEIVIDINDKTINGFLKDISACGASLTVKKTDINSPVILGDIVTFALASDSSYLKFEGNIIRTEDEGDTILIGISFY